MSTSSPPPLDSPGRARDIAHVRPPAEALGRKWAALLQAAGVVAMLADRAEAAPRGRADDFPAAIAAAGGWRLALAAQGVDDLAAVMETGLAALLAIHGRGADPTVAAQALWEEFAAAHETLLGLLPPPI